MITLTTKTNTITIIKGDKMKIKNTLNNKIYNVRSIIYNKRWNEFELVISNFEFIGMKQFFKANIWKIIN